MTFEAFMPLLVAPKNNSQVKFADKASVTLKLIVGTVELVFVSFTDISFTVGAAVSTVKYLVDEFTVYKASLQLTFHSCKPFAKPVKLYQLLFVPFVTVICAVLFLSVLSKLTLHQTEE